MAGLCPTTTSRRSPPSTSSSGLLSLLKFVALSHHRLLPQFYSRLRGGAKKRKKKNYTTPKKIKHKHRKVKLAVLKYYKVRKREVRGFAFRMVWTLVNFENLTWFLRSLIITWSFKHSGWRQRQDQPSAPWVPCWGVRCWCLHGRPLRPSGAFLFLAWKMLKVAWCWPTGVFVFLYVEMVLSVFSCSTVANAVSPTCSTSPRTSRCLCHWKKLPRQ